MNIKAILEKPSDGLLAMLLLAIFALLYLVFLGVRPLFIPDEVRYGEIAREMLVTGDWIVPRLNGLLYFEKPPFGHWVNAVSLWLFGATPFAVRFASALATGVSALTVFYVGNLLFDNIRTALVAVFIFLTTFEVQAVGTFGLLDPVFAATLNLGIACYIVASTRDGSARFVSLGLSGASLGLAFLAKGFLAFALPVLVIAPWLILQKEFRLLFLESWIVVVAAAVVVAPWAVAIHDRAPDFWRYFFWVEHIQRFSSENAQHKEPYYYYLLYLPVAAFPWVYMAPAAVGRLFKNWTDARLHSQVTLLALWAVVPFVFFSIANGKLITYILPCFVPFSLALAAGLSRSKAESRTAAYGMRIAAVFTAVVFAAVVYVDFIADGRPGYGTDESPKLVTVLTLLAVLTGAFMYSGAISRPPWIRIAVPGAAMYLLLTGLPWLIPEVTLERNAPVAFIEKIGADLPRDSIVVANGSLVRAVSWALKRSDLYVVDHGGETTFGLNAPDAGGRFLTGDAFGKLIISGKDILLICKRKCSPETLKHLPDDAVVSAYGIFVAVRILGAENH